MSYTYLQEQGEESLADSYLDIPQSVLSKLKNTQDKSYCSDNETESCQSFQSGTTYAHSTADPGEDQLTFWQEDFHAKTLVQQVKEQELPEHVRDCGKSMRELLTKYGLALSLPKTHHCFELGDLELSSKIWPRWGMMLDGACWELGMSVRRTSEIGCGYSHMIPTPRAQEPSQTSQGYGDCLNDVVMGRKGWDKKIKEMWPTPLRSDWKRRGPNSKQQGLPEKVRAIHTWPTPTTMDKLPPKSVEALHKEATQARPGRSRPANLRDCVHPEQMKAWPTPTAHNAKEQDSPSEATRNTPSLCHQARGGDKTQPRHLNPAWVEWLMGWPIGWTDLKPLETAKFRNVQQWHLEFYQKD